MMGLGFLFEKTLLARLKKKINICINVFCYENRLTFPIYILNQKFENSMDLLLVTDGDKSHYVYIKYFDRSCFTKQRIKTKYTFASYLQCFSNKNALTEHKKVCLSINGAQSVRL